MKKPYISHLVILRSNIVRTFAIPNFVVVTNVAASAWVGLSCRRETRIRTLDSRKREVANVNLCLVAYR